MVMPISYDSRNVMIIDKQSILPFQLVLLHGEGRNKREIFIDQLTTNPKQIHKFIYDIEELVNLNLQLMGQASEDIHVQWGAIQQLATDDVSYSHTLNLKNPIVNLYNASDSDGYPWRCGIYHFEIVYENKYYYGGFKVVPKNVTEKQIKEIYELVNAELKGLAVDYVNKKVTFGSLANIDDDSCWQFIQSHLASKDSLLNSLKIIENNSKHELKGKYVVESIPKHIDGRSLRWENSSKGQRFKGAKYLNRKLALHWDSSANQNVKHKLMQIAEKVEEAIHFVKMIQREYEKEYETITQDIARLEENRKAIFSTPLTTDRERRRLNNTLLSKNYELENITERLERNKDYYDGLRRSFLQINNCLRSNFWTSVGQISSQSTGLGNNIGYAMFNNVWRQLMGLEFTDGAETVRLPVYKPSSELYEYYVFFGVIHILQQINFRPLQETVSEQLMRTFFEDGLKDGSQVKFIQNDYQVHVTFDEMIDHNAQIAFENGRNFYSRGNHRKPDIRLDLYKLEDEQWNYVSSIIMEVKYRPFHNIYTAQGKTGTMDQLSEYWSIKYMYEKGQYVHNAVRKVVCIYPGADNREIKFSSEDGLFLQFYPDATSPDIYDIVGKTELKSLLTQWIYD